MAERRNLARRPGRGVMIEDGRKAGKRTRGHQVGRGFGAADPAFEMIEAVAHVAHSWRMASASGLVVAARELAG